MLRASGASARLVIGAVRACFLLAFAQLYSMLPTQSFPGRYALGSLILELSVGPQLQATHPGLLMPNLLNKFWIWLLSPETLVLRDNTYFLAPETLVLRDNTYFLAVVLLPAFLF